MFSFRRSQFVNSSNHKAPERVDWLEKRGPTHKSEVESALTEYVDSILTGAANKAKGLAVESTFNYKLACIPLIIESIEAVIYEIIIFANDYGLEYSGLDALGEFAIFTKTGDSKMLDYKNNPATNEANHAEQGEGLTVDQYVNLATIAIIQDAIDHEEGEYFAHTLISIPCGIKLHDLVKVIIDGLELEGICCRALPGYHDTIEVTGIGGSSVPIEA